MLNSSLGPADDVVDAPTPTGCSCGSDHFVQFYDEDDYLVRSLADYARGALDQASTVLLIATPAHLTAVAAELSKAHLDIAALQRTERYIVLDAADTLRRFMVNGRPDPALFETHVGTLVSRLTQAGQKLSAFGEMVALLFTDGQADAALELEGLWNDLARRRTLRLFCAYPMRVFAGPDRDREFKRVCESHHRVRPAETFLAPPDSTDQQLLALAILQQHAAAHQAELAERKRTEEALRRREAQLTAFVETASIGLHWVDADGIIIWANPAELQLLGYTAAEYIGQHIGKFHADQPVIERILACLSQGERLRDCEARLHCKDGTIKTVLIDSCVLWEDGRFVHTQCFTRDVTEQRRVEAVARRWAAIAESTDDAIYSLDFSNRITSWNEGAQRLFGYSPEEVIGQPTRLIPAHKQEEDQQIIAHLHQGGRIGHYETVRQRKDGTLVDVSITVSAVREADGTIAGVSKIARDITARKRGEQELMLAKEETARINRELEDRVSERTASLTDLLAQMESFSYAVSHDLRSPLRAISGYAAVLQADHASSLNDEGQHLLQRILAAGDRMSALITDLLAYARVNRERIEVAAVSLGECLDQVIDHAPELQAPRAEVIIAANLPPVVGNEAFVIQVFANLLGNAVKFVPPGRKPRVEITAETRGAVVQITIADNGIGIKPEQRSRLFGLFERANVDKRYEGTGIGLAIVRRALERMGGGVAVESDGETGSRFIVSLPHAAANARFDVQCQ